MGKKRGWFAAIKKALISDSKEKKEQKKRKSKKGCFGKSRKGLKSISVEYAAVAPPSPPPSPPPQTQTLPVEDVNLTEAENEQSKQAYSVALATAVAAEVAVAAAHAAAEVVRLSSLSRYPGKSKEEIAAIKIQTAFRGYLARRALQASRGLVRLKSLLQEQSVKRQAATILRCMHTHAHVQYQIRSRRIRMSEENQALQRQLLMKKEKELEKSKMGEEWDDSQKSKEQVEAKLQSKQEAALRRERALAYAFSHQQTAKNSSKFVKNPTFMDPTNPHWGWSWLERWMAARPWESRSTLIDYNDRASVKSSASHTLSLREISKSYYQRDLNNLNDHKPSPTSQKSTHRYTNRIGQSPSTPTSKVGSSSSFTGKSPKGKNGWCVYNEDSRSIFSVQSGRYRRQRIAGSSVRDDESLASSPSVLSYMTPTKSAKAKSRLPSPIGRDKNETLDKGSVSSVKKRLSFSASSSAQIRHFGPPKLDTSSNERENKKPDVVW